MLGLRAGSIAALASRLGRHGARMLIYHFSMSELFCLVLASSFAQELHKDVRVQTFFYAFLRHIC